MWCMTGFHRIVSGWRARLRRGEDASTELHDRLADLHDPRAGKRSQRAEAGFIDTARARNSPVTP